MESIRKTQETHKNKRNKQKWVKKKKDAEIKEEWVKYINTNKPQSPNTQQTNAAPKYVHLVRELGKVWR